MELCHMRQCCKRWLPVVYILLGACWGYYAYVFELCIATITSNIERGIYLVVFHLLFLMSLVSYGTTLFTKPAKPPKDFCLSESDRERYEKMTTQEDKQRVLREAGERLPISEIRYCERCQLLKPDGCHHCSTCDVCVLKMDHHCLVVNNCVGHSNYKSFLLLVMYSLLACLFVSGTSLRYFILTWTNDEGTTDLRILFCLSTAISILLFTFFIYHCYLLVRNRTTMDSLYAAALSGREGRPLGFKNFQEVFGHRKRYWLLPVNTSLGDGYSLPPLPDDPEKYVE